MRERVRMADEAVGGEIFALRRPRPYSRHWRRGCGEVCRTNQDLCKNPLNGATCCIGERPAIKD